MNKMDIAKRFDLILDGRKGHSLTTDHGILKSTVVALHDNRMPQAEGLIPLCVMERVSLKWMISGEGAPFEVRSFVDQREAAGWLSDFAGYSAGADIFIASAGDADALITKTQVTKEPAEGPKYRYIEINVLRGVDLPSMGLESSGVNLHALRIGAADYRDLVLGHMGNQAILRLAVKAEPITAELLQVAEARGAYTLPDQGQLIEKYNRLDPMLKRAVGAILDLKPEGDVQDFRKTGLGDDSIPGSSKSGK